MDTTTCLATLFDQALSIEQKARYLIDYLDWHARLGGAGSFGKEVAVRALFDSLPSRKEKQQLAAVLAEFNKHCDQQRHAQRAQARASIARLNDVPVGTWIVVKNGSREDVVCLIEVRRTRFICEFPDGRRATAPTQVFVRVHDGAPPVRLPNKERQQRELVRGLAGKDPMGATEDIFEQGPEILAILLEELGAAMDRVDKAPVGMNRGVNRDSVPFGKKVNQIDRTLVKRIPKVVALMARSYDIWQQIAQYPNPRVQEKCRATMGGPNNGLCTDPSCSNGGENSDTRETVE
ncbi:MAG: hypothetical protein ABSE73_00095 [Planctomycetota bacterium]